jgi:hypothetical protein
MEQGYAQDPCYSILATFLGVCIADCVRRTFEHEPVLDAGSNTSNAIDVGLPEKHTLTNKGFTVQRIVSVPENREKGCQNFGAL